MALGIGQIGIFKSWNEFVRHRQLRTNFYRLSIYLSIKQPLKKFFLKSFKIFFLGR